ncbi:MAG: hypothetical protein ACYCTI_09365, partial [Acidimicrobiales bacterium]
MTATGKAGIARQRSIWLLIAVLALASAVCWRQDLVSVNVSARLSHDLPWWGFALAFVATDLARFRFEFKEQGHELDLFELALVPALVFCAPPWLLVARLVGSAVSLGVVRRLPPIKLLFNMTQYCLRVGVAVLLAHQLGLGAHGPASPWGWIAILAACAGSELLARTSLVTVVWLAAGRPSAREILELALAGPLLILATSTLGIICALVLWANPWGIWMLLVIGVIAAGVHRVHHQLRRRYANLRILSRFTRDVSDAGTGGALVANVLDQARDILNSEWAELILREGGEISRTRSSAEGVRELREPTDRRSAWLLELGAATRIAPQAPANVAARRWIGLRSRKSVVVAPPYVEIEDALVSPLSGHEGLTEAVMVIGHRLGAEASFDDEDLELASTLAGAAGLALRNGRLVDALRSQADANEFQAR